MQSIPAVIIEAPEVVVPVVPAMTRFLHDNIRSLIAVSLTVVVCYLALAGVSEARAVLVSTFAVLAGSLWGERSALKQPGKDS